MSRREQSGDLYRPIHKEGTHLASSRDTDETFRGIIFDDKTNKLVGHAEWEKVDASEYERDRLYSPETQKLAQDILSQLIIVGAAYVSTEYVAPRVKLWWQNTVAPFTKGMWEGLTDKAEDKPSPKGKKKSDLHTNKIVTANETVQTTFHKLEEACEKYMNEMTSEEAQRELLDIFILSALLTAKIRKLSNARIIENGDAPAEYLEGQKMLERLTTPEYIDCINQILESNPQLLEEKTAGLSGILGRNLVLNGQYVPIEIGKFKEAIIM